MTSAEAVRPTPPSNDRASGPHSRQTHLTVIEPSGAWSGLDLSELWSHRELLFFLTWRDIKVRYKQTMFGIAWAVIQPLFLMLIFSLFFGRLSRIPSDGVPYPLFAYCGLVAWTFVSNAVVNSGNSLVGSANLVTKVYFPRLIIPGAAVIAGLVDYCIAGALAFLFLAYAGIPLTWRVLAILPLSLIATILALGLGLWMSALNVKYRDIRYALPFLIQLWMFATPIIYPSSLVPGQWRWVLLLNPLAGIVEGHRAALLGLPFDARMLAASLLITLLVFCGAVLVFRRMERSFADVI